MSTTKDSADGIVSRFERADNERDEQYWITKKLSDVRKEENRLAPEITKLIAVRKECAAALDKVVEAAEWRACELAHEMVTSGIKAWTPKDLIPAEAWNWKSALLGLITFFVMPLALILAWHYSAGLWTLLVMPVAWIVGYATTGWMWEKSGNAATAYVYKEERRTKHVYFRALWIKKLAGLRSITEVTPAVVMALDTRYKREYPARRAAEVAQAARDKEAQSRRYYGAAVAGTVAYVSSNEGTYYDDDSSSRYESSYEPSYYDEPACSYPCGQYNTNGIPMIENTCVDVTGHSYGTGSDDY